MIIEELRLEPFGGIRKGCYRFQRGLNVLLGPNEAGKSTLVSALFAVLFLPPDLRRSAGDWKNFLVRYLPHPGGDTARVSLRYTGADGERCTYSCSWGEIRGARLLLEGGAEINSPAGIGERMLRALRHGRGTYETVLFARQDEMERTLERLRDDDEALGTVAGILRRAVIEAGGVSLEELEGAIAAASEELLNNWDLERDGPRNNRGIDNPYQRGVGRLLAAYYESESLRRRVQQARELERRVDELSGQLEEMAKERAAVMERLRGMGSLERDIRRQGNLKPQLETIEAKASNLRRVLLAWPKTAGRVEELARGLERDQAKLAALHGELARAREQQAARLRRELLGKARPLSEGAAERERALSGLVAVSRADLQELRRWQKRAGELRAMVGAMKLQVRFATRRPVQLEITAGLDPPRSKQIGQEELIEGAGRLLLESADWSLEVQSGEGDVESLLQEIVETERHSGERLGALEVADIAAAEAVLNRRELLERELSDLRARLEVLLGGISFAALEGEVSLLPEEEGTRDPQVIQGEIASGDRIVAADESTLLLEQQRIEEWAAEYGSPEALAGQLGELERKVGEIQAELRTLAPLPEGCASADQFMADLEGWRVRGENLRESARSLELELVELRGELPEESSEELAEALADAEVNLARLREQARALTVVAAEFQALKEELDDETFEPLARSFAHYLGPVTGGRYTGAELEEVVPGSIIGAGGGALPVELLSTGTASGVALALRLAVAGYLLEGAAGFMIMDDPLVYLDPERRAQAAAVLQDFAREKQLIITTCDPLTAELLGGNTMAL